MVPSQRLLALTLIVGLALSAKPILAVLVAAANAAGPAATVMRSPAPGERTSGKLTSFRSRDIVL